MSTRSPPPLLTSPPPASTSSFSGSGQQQQQQQQQQGGGKETVKATGRTPPKEGREGLAADGRKEKEKEKETKEKEKEKEGERTVEGRGLETPKSVDSGLGREEWIAVQRKKTHHRHEGRVSVHTGTQVILKSIRIHLSEP